MLHTFDVLFDLSYDGFTPPNHLPLTTPEWTHDGLTLILDLLATCNDELQRHVLKCMVRMVGTSQDALRVWTGGRLFSLLQLTTKLTTGITSEFPLPFPAYSLLSLSLFIQYI
jgi:hypothetical protein